MKTNNIVPLEERRDMQDLVFLCKLLNGQIYSPEILSKVNLKVKGKATRSKDIFALRINRTNLGEHAPIHRMLKIGNIASCAGLDLFQNSKNKFWNFFLSKTQND